MEGYEDATYGDRIAIGYDEHLARIRSRVGGVELVVERLVELAASGRALELGVGTGPIAIPLAARGVPVVGIDVSGAMLDVLRAKPGADAVEVVVGSMEDVPTPGPFSVAYAVAASFFALRAQDAQVRCFANVAERLGPGGAFVLEAFVPDPALFDRGQRIATRALGLDYVVTEHTIHEPARQLIESQHVVQRADGRVELFPVVLRYCWPSELDLMARLAGLRLEARWRDWAKAPFGSADGMHVSVYRKP